MTLDVFGRPHKKTEGKVGPSGNGFRLTSEGQFNIDNKRLCNLAAPLESKDAVNLETLNSYLKSYKIEIDNEVQKKVQELTDLVKYHRHKIDEQIQKLKK